MCAYELGIPLTVDSQYMLAVSTVFFNDPILQTIKLSSREGTKLPRDHTTHRQRKHCHRNQP